MPKIQVEPEREIVEWGPCKFDVSQVNDNVKGRMRRNRYEGQTIDRITQLCPIDLPFINFGGGMGIVDCLHNKRMSDPTKHLSVEGNPQACILNAKNRKRNDCAYTILNSAVCYTDTVSFFVPDMATELIMAGSVDDRFARMGIEGKQVTVPGVTLKQLVGLTGWRKFALCIDIEGAEYAIVENELDVITAHCEWLLVEWHFSNEVDDPDRLRSVACKRALKKALRFEKDASSSRMSVFRGRRRGLPWRNRHIFG